MQHEDSAVMHGGRAARGARESAGWLSTIPRPGSQGLTSCYIQSGRSAALLPFPARADRERPFLPAAASTLPGAAAPKAASVRDFEL